MRRNRTTVRLAGGVLALGLVGAACAQDGTASGSAEESTTATGSGGAQHGSSTSSAGLDPAAVLARDLTNLLDSHVYLAGVTVEQAVLTKSTTSPEFRAAAAALDDNTQALTAAIESVYGADAAQSFESLWQNHIGFFVDYTVGGLEGDRRMQRKALDALDGYRRDFGALIEGATEGGLSARSVADALGPHVDILASAIDSVIAADGKAFDRLHAAARHNTVLSSALAGAIVEQFPEKFAR